jgi:hypothetical protein
MHQINILKKLDYLAVFPMKPIGGHSLSISTYSSSSKTNTAMFFQEKNGSVSFMGLTGQARPMPNNSGSIM